MIRAVLCRLRAARHDERGVSAIIVGVSILALVGVGAFVIDAGRIFEEHRNLQNAADAAVLGIAADCVNLGGSYCTPAGAQPEAERLAAANADDGLATVTDADITFDFTEREVTVYVHSLDDVGDPAEVDYVLAQVISDDDGQSVTTRASAKWSPPGGSASIPITISSCEWDNATGGGTVFGVYTIIRLHADGDSSLCDFGPGQDVDGDGDRNEGGFGYLDSSDCSSAVLVGDYMLGQTGAGNPGSLGCELDDILNNTLLVPIFDDIPDDGNPCSAPPGQPCYHIYGFAAFYVEDVDLNGVGWKNNGNICVANERCLGGQFVEFVSLEDYQSGPPGPDLGVYVLGLSG